MMVALLDARLDACVSKEMGPVLGDLRQQGVKRLLFDFSPTEYIPNAGLRLLISTAKKMQESGGTFIICSLKLHVRKVFEMAGIAHVFSICDSEEKALKRFG